MINKIAVGEVDKTESSLLKMWCVKEKQHLIVDNDKPWNSTEFATEGPVVTEIVEVGVERCKFLLMLFLFFHPGKVDKLFRTAPFTIAALQ